MKDIKLLYETTVDKQVEESVIEPREENGQKVEVKRTVKKVKPIKVALLKPDRKLFKAAEMFYAKTLSYYLKEGLMPFSLVAKRYTNDGGPLTNKELARLNELKEEAKKLEIEFYSAINDGTEAIAEKKKNALVRINNINLEVSNVQNAYADIFDTTAEVKARNDTMEWWTLFLLLIHNDKEYVSFFGDGTYEDRLKKLEEIESLEVAFDLEIIRKLSYLISFWLTARNNINKIDFESMDKLYKDTMTEYKVEEEKEIKVNEVK